MVNISIQSWLQEGKKKQLFLHWTSEQEVVFFGHMSESLVALI